MDGSPRDSAGIRLAGAAARRRADAAERVAGAPLDVLFRAMASGDAELCDAAWAECFRQYHRLVWTRVVYVIRTIPWLREPDEVAADVTATVFLGLPAAARRYREMGRAEQWLKQIAVRTALRHKEKLTGQWEEAAPARSERPGRTQVSFDEAVDGVVALMDRAEEADDYRELTRVLEAWRRDPKKKRWATIVQLRAEGYSHEEIAQRENIAASTSRTMFWQAKQELARELARDDSSATRDE